MMNGLLNVLHPTFDVLSECADREGPDAARSRTGRHLARCAACRAVVAEIRELGVAARLAEPAGVPEGLWLRIEKAATTSALEESASRETPPPDAKPWEIAPSLRPTRHWPVPIKRSLARVAGGLLVAAAALVAVAIGTGRTPSLLATAPSRITMTPFRPAPGATVHVRFLPPPRLVGQDRLVLAGQYLSDSRHAPSDFYFGGRFDSLATLRPAADGAMVGDFTVPGDFKAASIVVLDTTGQYYAADGLHSWLLIGGDQRGRPVLGSLLAALSVNALYGSPARASVLDTLQRYFPDHPAGFATADHYRGGGVFGDLLKFFQGAERKYVRFNSLLESQVPLDADRISAMIQFAYHIQEPAEAAKWTGRLVREHPDDPRALPLYAAMVHEVELREPPADTIRRYLPQLDALLSSAGSSDLSEGFALVNHYGDSTMQRRWALEWMRRSPGAVMNSTFNGALLHDREIREAASLSLRRALAASCVPPRWVSRGWISASRTTRYCTNSRARMLSELSEIALLDGRVAPALSLADSALVLFTSAGYCEWSPAHMARGRALLARADTLAAAREFATAFAPDTWQNADAQKAIVRQLGASVDSATWSALGSAAKVEARRCAQESVVRARLERGEP